MSGSQIYTKKVMNRSGFILQYPNVQSMDELLEDDVVLSEESSTQLFPLGTKLVRGEQCWRYTKNGGVALTAGMVLQSPAPAHAEQFDDVVVGAAAAAGTYSVEITSTVNLDGTDNDEVNNFAEGYLVVNDEAGEGHLYKIMANEALSGTDDSTFTLYDPIIVALTTSSQVGLVKNPFKDVIASTAVCTGMACGVAPMAVTAEYYFWMPTGGPAPCVAHASIAIGDLVVAGTTAAKADPAAALETTEAVLGVAMTPAVTDGESFVVFLWIDR